MKKPFFFFFKCCARKGYVSVVIEAAFLKFFYIKDVLINKTPLLKCLFNKVEGL